MKNLIYILTDYKDYFGSKIITFPHRSGMDKDMLKQYLKEKQFEVIYLSFPEIDLRKHDFRNRFVLYTSTEDFGYYYKSYIEDLIHALSLQGAFLIPPYRFLRATNNKVFMEMLRDLSDLNDLKNIRSKYFGSLGGLLKNLGEFTDDPYVIKKAAGAGSSGVYLSKNRSDLIKKCKRVSRTKHLRGRILEYARSLKHKNYYPDSKYRNKFIVQNFIKNLKNDWKVLIYGDKYYIFQRGVRENDFRASGSRKFIFTEEIPQGILEFCKKIFEHFNVPNISLDIAFDGNEFYLLEFQGLYYGTYGLEHSPFYYLYENAGWKIIHEKSILEQVFAESIVSFIYLNYMNKI